MADPKIPCNVIELRVERKLDAARLFASVVRKNLFRKRKARQHYKNAMQSPNAEATTSKPT